MPNQNSISVVLPLFNEEKNIKQTVDDTFDYFQKQSFFDTFEVIAVNDGSTDQTKEILDQLCETHSRLRIVSHPKNLGYGAAMMTGIKNAVNACILLMDGDGQIHISSVDAAVEYISDYDIITGFRVKRRDPVFRVLLGKAYTNFVALLFGVRLKDVNCGFKLIKKGFLDIDAIDCHAGVFYTNIFIYARSKQARIKEVPIEHFPRSHGKQTGASAEVIYEALFDLIKLKFSKKSNK